MNAVFKKLALGALILLGLSTGAAFATPMTANYTISGTFADPYHTALPGGTFSGTFSVSGNVNASNVFTNYAITALNIGVTSFTDIGGHTFSNLNYTLANSTLSGAGLFNYFQLDTAGGDEFRIYFTATRLSTTGASLALLNSYDHQPFGGNRALLSGSVLEARAAPVRVPEPSSIALLGTALVLLAGAFAIQRKRAPATVIA